jgi:hypothetical protein
MKTVLALAMGFMLVVAVTFAANDYAVAAPPGGGGHGGHHRGHHRGFHGGHHRGFYGGTTVYGPGTIIVDEVEEVECRKVRKCYTTQSGTRRCRVEEVCD